MERQPRSIRERMRSYYPRIKAIYSYYAASSNEGSPFTLNMSEMRNLMAKCDLPFSHLDILWAETNYESVKDDGNADRELARFEFVEMCIRLAFEHFVPSELKHGTDKTTKQPHDVMTALDSGLVELMDEHVLPQAWRSIPHARYFADPDAFRRERMYTEQGKYLSEGAAREWSTVVDISIPPPSFKPVSLSLPRSPLSKTPKQVFFNPINIFDIFYTLYYCFIIYFFV